MLLKNNRIKFCVYLTVTLSISRMTAAQECDLKCTCQSNLMDCSKRTLGYAITIPRRIQTVKIQHANLTTLIFTQDEECQEVMKTELNLAHNNFVEMIGVDLSCEATQFTRVIFDNNNFTKLNSDGVKWRFYAAKHISLKNNKIESVATASFHFHSQFDGLESLNLARNRLRTIEKEAFPGSLIKLDLSWNAVQVISGNAFSNLKEMLSINLSHNKLQTIHGDVFKGLRSLKHVDLSGNLFERIPYNALQRVALKDLNLSNNKISTTLSFDVLLLRIDAVNLSHNQIKTHSFASKFKNIKNMNLSYNLLSSLGEAPVQKTMETVDVSHNLLHDLNITKLFSNVSNLKQVNASYNSIRIFDINWSSFNSSTEFNFDGNDASCYCKDIKQINMGTNDSEYCTNSHSCNTCRLPQHIQDKVTFDNETVCQTTPGGQTYAAAFAALAIIPIVVILIVIIVCWLKRKKKIGSKPPSIVMIPSNRPTMNEPPSALPLPVTGDYAMADPAGQSPMPVYTEVNKSPTVVKRNLDSRNDVESGIYERISAYMETSPSDSQTLQHMVVPINNSTYSQANDMMPALRYERAEVALYASTE